MITAISITVTFGKVTKFVNEVCILWLKMFLDASEVKKVWYRVGENGTFSQIPFICNCRAMCFSQCDVQLSIILLPFHHEIKEKSQMWRPEDGS